MVVTIDFTTDTIIKWSKLDEPDDVTKFQAPLNYDPMLYDYVPSTPGIFDPDGFIIKNNNIIIDGYID